MKTKHLFMLMLITMSLTSCKYDDSELKDSITVLEERISAMESKVEQMNGNIASIKVVVNSLEQKIYVTKVEKLSGGYTIFFTDGTSASISNGKNGQDAPVIGIALEDGTYYWTLTVGEETSWLRDADGNKLCVSGNNGIDGIAGITPCIKIDEKGYWIVSYDNGISYSRILDADNKPVSAIGIQGDKGDKGDTGSQGPSGASGDSFFKSVVENEDAVILTLTNNTVITIPKVKVFGILFQQTKKIPIGKAEVQLQYTITGADSDTFVEIYAKGNLEAVQTNSSISQGVIVVKATGTITKESKVVVLLCNKEKTITTILTFEAETFTMGSGSENYSKEDGIWDK